MAAKKWGPPRFEFCVQIGPRDPFLIKFEDADIKCPTLVRMLGYNLFRCSGESRYD